MRGKKHDVKINIISDGAHATTAPGRHAKQPASSGSNNSSSRGAKPALTTRHKLPVESMSVNNSVSNLTASTYCNGHSSALLDDSSTSNYGDGEESSVVSSMMHPPQRWPIAGVGGPAGGGGGGLRHKDLSCSECSSTFSSSTLERDLEIIDLLERERSMDIQEMMQREQQGEKVRLSVSGGVGRQLPDIEKLYAQRSPRSSKRDSGYGYDKAALELVMPGTDPLSISLSSSSQPSTEYSLCSTLQEQQQLTHPHHLHQPLQQRLSQQQLQLQPEVEEEVPQDFYDSYTPGGRNNLPPAVQAVMAAQQASAVATAAPPPPAYQYQYTRRLSRKSSGTGSHHHVSSSGGIGSIGGTSRGSKRDSFNSLNGTDLIAGAFCELDPTQPLNKMAGLEGRMRRSSPRNASFSSSSARSSLKSRDYGHGSAHSTHPELDFRENIFAEL